MTTATRQEFTSHDAWHIATSAAYPPEALHRSTAADGKTELFNLPGYPLMVRAVDFNRIHAESEMRRAALLDEMQKAALAAVQATAAQAVVQDDLITLRKPTTSAELLWLLKLAHLVISDVDKTLEETFAPAQPAVEASRFGSPELQAMIIARCVEKDQVDSVQEDAALWHWLAEYLVGTRTDLDDEIVASETVNDLRKLVKAAIKQGESNDR